jgi:hypothetical protein
MAVTWHVLVQFMLSALMSLSVICTGRVTSLMDHHTFQNKFIINAINFLYNMGNECVQCTPLTLNTWLVKIYIVQDLMEYS